MARCVALSWILNVAVTLAVIKSNPRSTNPLLQPHPALNLSCHRAGEAGLREDVNMQTSAALTHPL